MVIKNQPVHLFEVQSDHGSYKLFLSKLQYILTDVPYDDDSRSIQPEFLNQLLVSHSIPEKQLKKWELTKLE